MIEVVLSFIDMSAYLGPLVPFLTSQQMPVEVIPELENTEQISSMPQPVIDRALGGKNTEYPITILEEPAGVGVPEATANPYGLLPLKPSLPVWNTSFLLDSALVELIIRPFQSN